MSSNVPARPSRVVVLGAGFGGLELSTKLQQECGDAVEITLIDKAPGFVFGFSKLDVMFGKATAEYVTHLYRDAIMPGVKFLNAAITRIDPVQRVVETSDGTLEADYLVIALGAALDPAATPGLLEGGYEFYTNAGAFALRNVLAEFKGGRVIVGVTSAPFKCPPAPSETAMLMHQYLTDRGLRDRSEIALVMPFGRPIPPSPDASAAILERFERFGISWHPNHQITGLDPARKVALLSAGEEMPYDLFLGVPHHIAPQVVIDSGLTTDGWIPVDPYTLTTSWPNVYAVGDVTSVGTPKAGIFSEGQARIAADQIIAKIQGRTTDSQYDGVGRCYLEFGKGEVGQVDITFAPGQPPHGSLTGPNESLEHDKNLFGSDRAQRWFGRTWQITPESAGVR